MNDEVIKVKNWLKVLKDELSVTFLAKYLNRGRPYVYKLFGQDHPILESFEYALLEHAAIKLKSVDINSKAEIKVFKTALLEYSVNQRKIALDSIERNVKELMESGLYDDLKEEDFYLEEEYPMPPTDEQEASKMLEDIRSDLLQVRLELSKQLDQTNKLIQQVDKLTHSITNFKKIVK
jgi:hypothetical protein